MAKLGDQLDEAIRCEGKEPVSEILLPPKVREDLLKVGYPADKVNLIRGYYTEVEDHVLRLFRTKAAASGKIRLKGKRVYFEDGKEPAKRYLVASAADITIETGCVACRYPSSRTSVYSQCVACRRSSHSESARR